MALAAVTLDDKYGLDEGRIFLTGIQALVRLPMVQRRRDVAAGLNTGCFVSGYRGSPLGGLDMQFMRARQFLERHHITIQPAVNEDLGATAVWGSQQVGLTAGARYDGVFALWYGKGPGVDRSGDVLKHGNLAGTAPHGGVLALAGDDHTCKSSTTAHQSEYALMDASIPVLNPSGVQEVLDYGLVGLAMSRYSGCWIALKTIAETVDSAASIPVDPAQPGVLVPDDFEMPPGGLNIRWPDTPLEQEERLHRYKLYAALAFAGANRLDTKVIDGPRRRFGIITAGKSYLDVRQALEDLGIDDAAAAALGLSVYKVAMTWPLEREGIRRFAEGLEEVPGRRGEARGHREPGQGAALQLACRHAAPGARQVRRRWQLDPAVDRRADAGPDRPRHRRPHRPLPHLARHSGQYSRAAALPGTEGGGARRAAGEPDANPLFLLGLSAQHFDDRARGQPRSGRHRLPLHGDLDGP